MKTSLYDIHQSLDAKIVDFSGWQMPLQYKGILHEHHVVRTHAGLFDVSHMGRIIVEGPDALKLLNSLSTNDLSLKKPGSATYTIWCRENGSCIDDVIILFETLTKYSIIVNASNRESDYLHLKTYAKGMNVSMSHRYFDDGILALQGPKSEKILMQLFPEVKHLKRMHMISLSYRGNELIIARTGYTGEDGMELYIPNSVIVDLWNHLLLIGAKDGLEPIGLGARDTLRLEKGYALYGHELNDSILASESVSAWTIKWDKPNFLGKEALSLNFPHRRHAFGVILLDKGIARDGYLVEQMGKTIGKVTSGTLSPTLNLAIALILVEKNLAIDDIVDIQIRQNLCRAKVVALPFL